MAGCKCERPGHCPWHQTIVDQDALNACRKGVEPPAVDPLPCVYLGDTRGVQSSEGHLTYQCYLHNSTTIDKYDGDSIRSCRDCIDYATAAEMPEKFKDPLRVTDRNGNDTDVLKNLLCDGNAFLVCGGPSTKQVDFMQLRERGIFSLGVNNVAAFVPVSAFVCSDPPSKFWDGIFKDSKIMKFLPTPKLRGRRSRIRERKDDGSFVQTKKSTAALPNVWGFERRSWLTCDETWFLSPGAAWGNHSKGVTKTGEEKSVCTMLLGLRLLQYLGAKRIFLLGCDFWMDERRGKHDNYSFGEERDAGACRSNNNIYRVVNEWLIRLRPTFEKYGFETYNCYEHSRLRAFDYCPFEDAVEICRSCPAQAPDLAGWYKK